MITAKKTIFFLCLLLFVCESDSHASLIRVGTMINLNPVYINWTGSNSSSYKTTGVGAGPGIVVSLLPDAIFGLRFVAVENFISSSGDGSNGAAGQKAKLDGWVPMGALTANLNLDQGNFHNSYGIGLGIESLTSLHHPSSFPNLSNVAGPVADLKSSKKGSSYFAYGQFFIPLSRSLDLNVSAIVGAGFDFGGAAK